MANSNGMTSRQYLAGKDIVEEIWSGLSLPGHALDSLDLESSDCDYPSSFMIAKIAQAATALSALGAALVESLRTGQNGTIRSVSAPVKASCLQYQAASLYSIDGSAPEQFGSAVGGLHPTKDGYVRIHDAFPNHRDGALKLLGLPTDATKEQVDAKLSEWEKLDLEQKAHENKVAIYALRSYDEWDVTAQAQALKDFPIQIRKISDSGQDRLPTRLASGVDRCLRGIKVVELSRVIAAPVAGKTLASHGADVYWVTSPNLPNLPSLDPLFSRGKRPVSLDLDIAKDQHALRELIKDCDVFIQGYRPGGLASRGFSGQELAKLNPNLIYANMSAFGPDGPWSDRRGFDSLVQTCSGIQVSEAEHFGAGQAARPMPCQALDHTSGLLLATGICAALYRRAKEGGSWEVHVSLAGTMKYLRSLGQKLGKEGFDCTNPAEKKYEIPDEHFDSATTRWGVLRSIREAATIEGVSIGFDDDIISS